MRSRQEAAELRAFKDLCGLYSQKYGIPLPGAHAPDDIILLRLERISKEEEAISRGKARAEERGNLPFKGVKELHAKMRVGRKTDELVEEWKKEASGKSFEELIKLHGETSLKLALVGKFAYNATSVLQWKYANELKGVLALKNEVIEALIYAKALGR